MAVAAIGALGAAAFAATSFVDFTINVINRLGVIEDEVAVTVTGTPISSKKQLYFLAAATAFGLAKNLQPRLWGNNPLGSPGLIGVEYDAAAKEVTFILRLKQSLLILALARWANEKNEAALKALRELTGAAIVPRDPDSSLFIENFPILAGPKDGVVGGQWNFVGPQLPGEVVGAAAGGAIGSIFGPIGTIAGGIGGGIAGGLFVGNQQTIRQLPNLTDPSFGGFANKVILTDTPFVRDPNPNLHPVPIGSEPQVPTPNPRPVGDARSRGTLAWMVWQSLANPCESNDGLGTHTYGVPNNSSIFSGG
jgi:hypothetical protein